VEIKQQSFLDFWWSSQKDHEPDSLVVEKQQKKNSEKYIWAFDFRHDKCVLSIVFLQLMRPISWTRTPFHITHGKIQTRSGAMFMIAYHPSTMLPEHLKLLHLFANAKHAAYLAEKKMQIVFPPKWRSSWTGKKAMRDFGKVLTKGEQFPVGNFRLSHSRPETNLYF